MDTDTDESRAVLGHVAGFLLPLVGPMVLLMVSRDRGRLVRHHLAMATVVSGLWLVLAVGVISLDAGHLTLDEQQTSTGGLAALAVVAGLVLSVILVNVQRAKRQRLPVGWPTRKA
jgi:hypothetical protein